MTTLRYSSGDEILPGDKVECADGTQGEVVFTLTPGEASLSNPHLEHFRRGFVVRKCDGTSVHYQPSDPSVRLLSHPHIRLMTSKTMHATIKKVEFLQLLEDLGSHSLYYPEPLSKLLADCGLSTVMAPDGQSITLEGQLITVSTPEWGEPGISPSSVLCVVYEIATGEKPRSNMTGRGFWYRNVMNKLASYWGIDAKY